MTNHEFNESQEHGRDQVHPGAVQWNLPFGAGHTSDILWRCDALRAGKLYSRTLFGTREEAEQFGQQMQRAEPDHMFNVEAIKASTVWN